MPEESDWRREPEASRWNTTELRRRLLKDGEGLSPEQVGLVLGLCCEYAQQAFVHGATTGYNRGYLDASAKEQKCKQC